MSQPITLVSHLLCPYVQRAAIVLLEKGVPFTRKNIDLANKPDWFLAISPLGKVPVLQVGETAIFESAVICEYLDETQAPQLHPADPLARARHRGWMELGSAILNDIAGVYSAPDEASLQLKAQQLAQKWAQVEAALSGGPYFAGAEFTLVDAVFAPVFRYYDAFEAIAPLRAHLSLTPWPQIEAWRRALAQRPSVQQAVVADYPQRLQAFLQQRKSYLGTLLQPAAVSCSL